MRARGRSARVLDGPAARRVRATRRGDGARAGRVRRDQPEHHARARRDHCPTPPPRHLRDATRRGPLRPPARPGVDRRIDPAHGRR